MSKIYTKKGDFGNTSNLAGNRKKKCSSEFSLVGTLDELNANLGTIEIWKENYNQADIQQKINQLREEVNEIQSDLFNLSANISCISKSDSKFPFEEKHVIKLEKCIDEMTENLSPLRNFIFPRSQIQVSRSVCRRAERKLVKFAQDNPELYKVQFKYMNRLSDYLFTLDRYYSILMDEKHEDIKFNSK